MEKFVRRGREFWVGLVTEFEREGGVAPHGEFAEKHGVRIGAFRRWLYRLSAEKQGRRWGTRQRKPGRPSKRMPPWPLVEVQTAPSVDGRFEIELAGGHRLRVPMAFDADALRRLLTMFDEKSPA